MELSGATVANWVSKTANLLQDGYGGPSPVGLLLPLHWQLPCFLLGAAVAGATVRVASGPSALAGCSLAFVGAPWASAALDAGVDDVLVCSGHPLGARLPSVPALCLDAALEIPTYGDHYAGPFAASATIELDGTPFGTPDLGLGPTDRVLVAGTPADVLGVVLATLAAGASLVLLADGDAAAVAAAERVTASAGVAVPGVREL